MISKLKTHRSSYKVEHVRKQNKIQIKKYYNNNTETEGNITIDNSDNNGDGEQKIEKSTTGVERG